VEHIAKNICNTVITSKEQTLKKWLNLEFPYFLTHAQFGQIQYFHYHVGTLQKVSVKDFPY